MLRLNSDLVMAVSSLEDDGIKFSEASEFLHRHILGVGTSPTQTNRSRAPGPPLGHQTDPALGPRPPGHQTGHVPGQRAPADRGLNMWTRPPGCRDATAEAVPHRHPHTGD